MTINSYPELQGAIARWLGRDDLAANVPDFITLFEATANRRLRTRQMQIGVVLTLTNGAATLPTDFLSAIEVTVTGSVSPPLEHLSIDAMRFLFPNGSVPGFPRAYHIGGGGIDINPFDDNLQLFLAYYQKIPRLIDGGFNWLALEHPDAYLFGALAEAEAFMVDLEKTAFWKVRRDEIFDEIQILSNKSLPYSGMRVLAPTP